MINGTLGNASAEAILKISKKSKNMFLIFAKKKEYPLKYSFMYKDTILHNTYNTYNLISS